jgi:division protein CdvB (Snf7/Vps24/ESCRT-III family)
MSDSQPQHFSQEDITRLNEVISEGVQLKHEIDTLSGGLKDTVKHIAEEVGVKPAQLNKAINIVYKNSLSEEQHKFDEVIEIIEATGRGTK